MIKKRIGLIGVGNMGTAILDGLFDKGLARPRQVSVYDKIKAKSGKYARNSKVRHTQNIKDLLKYSEVILLAVKPQDLENLGREMKTNFASRHIFISILAGTPITKIKKALGAKARVVRAMPNLGAKVGESITALSSKDKQALSVAKKIFSGCGKTVVLNEKHFDLVTAISGSGPAYFFLLMELLVNVGIKNKLTRKDAEALAVQTALGSALLAQQSQVSPDELRKRVTSKKGTTEAALTYLKKNRFGPVFEKAVHAALKRGKELSRD